MSKDESNDVLDDDTGGTHRDDLDGTGDNDGVGRGFNDTNDEFGDGGGVIGDDPSTLLANCVSC